MECADKYHIVYTFNIKMLMIILKITNNYIKMNNSLTFRVISKIGFISV